jgi:hypothetical protein
VPDGFDAAYAFDVIEHVPDAFAFLREMEKRAALVEVNLLGPEPGDQDLHHELPIDDILARAARLQLVAYKVLHGRSHLVLYRPQHSGSVGRALGRARLVAGRARARFG